MGELPLVILMLIGAVVCLFGVRIIVRHEITRRELEEKQKAHDEQMLQFELLRSELGAKKSEFDALAIKNSLSEVDKTALWSKVVQKVSSAVMKLFYQETDEALQLMNEASAEAEKILVDLRSGIVPEQTE